MSVSQKLEATKLHSVVLHCREYVQKVQTDWKDTMGATFNQPGSFVMRSSSSLEGVSNATDSSMCTAASPCMEAREVFDNVAAEGSRSC